MTHPVLKATVEGLFLGKTASLWRGKPTSAILKTAAVGPQRLTSTGFETDEQADLKVHGGPDKAVHHYAADHYADWQAAGLLPPGMRPAAFGENISTYGITDQTVCIGDIFRLGTALVQISQGRQPCWKLNAHTGQDQMAYHFQKMQRTGWYYRVLVPGVVETGDDLSLVERPHPHWSVAKVTHARLSRQIKPAEAQTLADMPDLAPGWRTAFAGMATGISTEDTGPRLNPPAP